MWQRKCQGTYETPSRAIRGKEEGCEHPSQRFFTDRDKFQKHTVHTSRNEQETWIYVWFHSHLSSRTVRNSGGYWQTGTYFWPGNSRTEEERLRCSGTYAKTMGTTIEGKSRWNDDSPQWPVFPYWEILNNHGEMLKDLQCKQHLMEENERIKFAEGVGTKKTGFTPMHIPRWPRPFPTQESLWTDQGERDWSRASSLYFCPIGDFFFFWRPATPPIGKISATFG